MRALTKVQSNLYLGMSKRHEYAATAERNANWTVACWPITAYEGRPDGPVDIIGEHLLLKDADELVYKHITAHS